MKFPVPVAAFVSLVALVSARVMVGIACITSFLVRLESLFSNAFDGTGAIFAIPLASAFASSSSCSDGRVQLRDTYSSRLWR
eukprot:scaffold6235_cov24-Attheya_sp.AAC.1